MPKRPVLPTPEQIKEKFEKLRNPRQRPARPETPSTSKYPRASQTTSIAGATATGDSHKRKGVSLSLPKIEIDQNYVKRKAEALSTALTPKPMRNKPRTSPSPKRSSTTPTNRPKVKVK